MNFDEEGNLLLTSTKDNNKATKQTMTFNSFFFLQHNSLYNYPCYRGLASLRDDWSRERTKQEKKKIEARGRKKKIEICSSLRARFFWGVNPLLSHISPNLTNALAANLCSHRIIYQYVRYPHVPDCFWRIIHLMNNSTPLCFVKRQKLIPIRDVVAALDCHQCSRLWSQKAVYAY